MIRDSDAINVCEEVFTLSGGDICCLLIPFAKSLDQDQDRHSVGTVLDPNCLPL